MQTSCLHVPRNGQLSCRPFHSVSVKPGGRLSVSPGLTIWMTRQDCVARATMTAFQGETLTRTANRISSLQIKFISKFWQRAQSEVKCNRRKKKNRLEPFLQIGFYCPKVPNASVFEMPAILTGPANRLSSSPQLKSSWSPVQTQDSPAPKPWIPSSWTPSSSTRVFPPGRIGATYKC